MDLNEELTTSHPAKVFVWLQDWQKEGKPIVLESEINWLGLAQTAAAKAGSHYNKSPVVEALLWGSIAIKIREELAKAVSSFEAGGTFANAMLVRTNLIAQYGNYPEDPICDANLVLGWFQRTLCFSFDECERLIKIWPNLEASGNFEFKMVFDRLEQIRQLHEAKRIVPDQEISRWLELLEEFDRAKRQPRTEPFNPETIQKVTYKPGLF